jgi:uncharacterized RDD family membrane protein YckC
MDSILPLRIKNGADYESPYAGFWLRAAAHFLDILIWLLYIFAEFYLERIDYFYVKFFLFFGIAFRFFWFVYLLKRFGGTPGKLICGIKVIRKDGTPVGWREAFLRSIVDFPYAIYAVLVEIWLIHQMGYGVFQNLPPLEYGKFVHENKSSFDRIASFSYEIWFWGELVVLLFNERKRAIHDFIAGTVVVKKKMLPAIEKSIA